MLNVVAVSLACLGHVGAAEPAAKPNIIFILADDLGWGDLGCYGNPHIKTPRLDRLARQGTLFTQFYVNGSVCSPSRTAFMTGQFPARHRIHGHLAGHPQNEARGMPDWLDPAAPSLARQLKQAGYATAHFGKWHLGSGKGAPEPAAYGFDDYRTFNGNGPAFDEKNEYFRARSTGLIVDETIRFVEANRDRRFYVNLWTLVPHATLHPTDEQMEPYKQFGPMGVPYHGAEEVYYGTVTAMDAELGRLFDKLDALELADNTIVLFSSDNGPEDIHVRNASHSGVGTAGPFRGRKRSLYEGGVRVPFIVRWPTHVPAGCVDDESVISAVDFLPTLGSLAGASLPEGHQGDGEDIGDILTGTPRPRRTTLFWQWRFGIVGYPMHHSPMLSVRDGRWKLLLNPDRGRVELYDVLEDRMEIDNVSAEHPDVVERLAEGVMAWQATLPPGPLQARAGQVNYQWPTAKKRR